MIQELSLTRPDDWHLHLRDGAEMASVVHHSAERFGRAIVMPNLDPPITRTAQARAYRDRIRNALPPDHEFTPLMTLYLTDHLDPREIRIAKDSGLIYGIKLYPAGATTNSDRGVTGLRGLAPIFEALQTLDLPLLIHGEATGPAIDVFDREARFLETELAPLIRDFPELRIVLEHITTKEAVAFVREAPAPVAATITPHHLLYDRNALFAGGIRPHYFCLPILKRAVHRQALLEAATSGDPKFFLGTDSAPHAIAAKERACGCAGIFSAHGAIELYAEAFDSVGALDRLEAFASGYGPDFYRLPRNRTRIRLVRQPWRVPEYYAFGSGRVRPLRAGETIAWRLA